METAAIRKITMPCMIGTSFISHFDFGQDEKERLAGIKEFNALTSTEEKTAFLSEHLVNKSLALWQKIIADEIDDICSDRDATFPTAELQSIIRWLSRRDRGPGKKTELNVVLLQNTYNNNGEELQSPFNASLTLFYLQALDRWELLPGVRLAITCKDVPLDVSNEKVFVKSLDTLFKELDLIYDEARRDGREFIVNTSGGYKAISAYAMLYAQLREVPALYTFERGNYDAVELTSFPVAYALSALDEEMSLLKALKGGEEILKTVARKKNDLPIWIRSLIMTSGHDEDPVLSPLADTLLDAYTRSRRGSEAMGSGMLDILEGSDEHLGPKLKNYIKKRIENEWAELWLGDQIPETVEHSRRHSKRLMEFAANLYRTAEEPLRKMELASPRALALLVACIYLHDIGHTAIAYPIVDENENEPTPPFSLGSFPSSVREVHHLLSAKLIEKKTEELFPAADETDITFLRTLVPLLGAYHRGYTTLSHEQGEGKPKEQVKQVGCFLFGTEAFELTLLPLQNKLEALTESERGGIPVEHLLDVAALLRIIDGSDVQADRVVDQVYLEARLKRTKEEAEILLKELNTLKKVYSQAAEKLPDLMGHVDEISRIAQTFDIRQIQSGEIEEKVKEQMEQQCTSVYEEVFQKLQDMKAGASFPGVVHLKDHTQTTLLSLANRIAFKWEQFLHFYKHQCVGTVFPVCEENIVTVHIWPNKMHPSSKEIANAGERRKALDEVKMDIEKEWCRACKAGEKRILLPELVFKGEVHR